MFVKAATPMHHFKIMLIQGPERIYPDLNFMLSVWKTRGFGVMSLHCWTQ